MKRISLENEELEGVNNTYLVDADGRTVLVDTGGPTREETLRTALAAEGLAFGDVDELFLTHWHPDHTGLAHTIQEAGGATVRIHEADAPLVTEGGDAWAEFSDIERTRLEAWGVPEQKREQLAAHQDRTDSTDPRALSSVTTLSDGETFAFGDHVLTVVHTPGHTAGSICLELEDATSEPSDAEIVTGDTLLPNYTPNVGGTDARLERPLDDFLASLQSLAAGEYTTAWPGHRTPIEDPTERAHEIIAHHEQRAGRILAILDRLGPSDVWTISTELFGTLERFHILVGAGEAYAHLAHLEEQGDVERVDGSYRLVESVQPDIDGETDTWPLAVSGSQDSTR
jgi:glyoxylase-like metal-dependent hydrolase (beta-lactamase superfamily II)